jgi:diacylglycerol kinase (ATP)
MKKLIRSFGYAFQGIRYSFAGEQNFRIHVFAAIIAVAAAIFLKCSAGEWLIIVICIAAMLSLEMLNTAIEQLCDLHNQNFDPKIKIIKDVSAGAVLVAAVASAVCGAIIFVPKIISLF